MAFWLLWLPQASLRPLPFFASVDQSENYLTPEFSVVVLVIAHEMRFPIIRAVSFLFHPMYLKVDF